MNSVQLYSSRVIECSQENEYSDTYKVKFVICDFEKNHNNVKINRDKIKNWMDTLVNKPVVGKLVSTGRGGMDFAGHGAKIVVKKDSDGNLYKDMVFDTSAFGTFTGVDIEKVDDEECIVATCEIWKRFENACALIMKRVESGTLNTSWEIDVLESHYEDDGGTKVKVLDDGVFVGHCLLGAAVKPAYDCSRLLEVAEATPDFDAELADAIQQDMGVFAENIEDKEVNEMKFKNGVGIVTSEDEAKKPVEGEDKKPKDSEATGKSNPDESKDDHEGDDNKGKKSTSESKKDENETDSEPEEKQEDETDKQEQEDDEKKKETSEAEISSLTVNDLCNKLSKLIRGRGVDGYVAMLFPEDHEIWVKSFEQDVMELEFLRFTYSVEGDEISLSEPEKVTLVASPKDVNSVISERDNKIESLNDAIASANTQIQEKDNEIASLSVYKEKFEKAEQGRIDAEIAERKENLRKYAVSSGLITEAEVAENGELAQLIESNDEAGIKNVIAERFMAKNAEKKSAPKKETSEIKSEEKMRLDLKNYSSEPMDYVSVMKAYLGK